MPLSYTDCNLARSDKLLATVGSIGPDILSRSTLQLSLPFHLQVNVLINTSPNVKLSLIRALHPTYSLKQPYFYDLLQQRWN